MAVSEDLDLSWMCDEQQMLNVLRKRALGSPKVRGTKRVTTSTIKCFWRDPACLACRKDASSLHGVAHAPPHKLAAAVD